MTPLASTLLIVSPLLVAITCFAVWLKFFSHKIGVTPVEEPMLRAPGESLRQRIEELNELFDEQVMKIIMFPFVFGLVHHLSAPSPGKSVIGTAIFSVATAAAVIFYARKGYKTLRTLRNCRLGYAGECLVAERLLPLHQEGFFVFHDCPADNHGNIDHIVLTPTKVYAIETKTRRKRLSSETLSYEAQVTYDGRSLIYPHGVEDFGLNQARRQARWLSDLLSEHLCSEVPVQPVLALPGWMVERTGRGDVAVVNPKQLPVLMRERPSKQLRPETRRRMEQIRVVLEKRCRNLPFPGVTAAQDAKRAAQCERLKRRRKAKAETNRPDLPTPALHPSAAALSAR